MSMPDLKTSLLDLLYEIRKSEIVLIIGGGFGIYLRSEYIRGNAERTLLQEWPAPRSTNDLDLFLRTEFLIDSTKIKPLADALQDLGYTAVIGAEKYQFINSRAEGRNAGSVKIDILTGPPEFFQSTHVKVDERRIRPQPSVGLHAHPVPEAITLENEMVRILLEGKLNNGIIWQSEVLLPHPYTFLMMKLFAFKDRIDDNRKDYGRYHALDMYTVVAMMTESEWKQALTLRDLNCNDPYQREAGLIINHYFSDHDKAGIIRLRENPYFRPEFQLKEFISVLQELFPIR